MQKIVRVLMIVALMLPPMASKAQDTLTVNLTMNDTALGSISPAEGVYHLTLGDSLVLTAYPNENAAFNGWKVFVGGVSFMTLPAALNPFTFTCGENNLALGEATFMAMFVDSTSVPDSMTLTLNTDNPVMGTTNPAPGVHRYAVGDTIMMAPVANEGYHFKYWIQSMALGGMLFNDTVQMDVLMIGVTNVFAGTFMNFTAYFEANNTDPVSIDQVDMSDVRIYTVGNSVVVTGADGREVKVYDISGREVGRENLPDGVYMVKVGTLPTRKVVVAR